MQARLRNSRATSAALRAGKVLLEQANARLEGEKAAQQAALAQAEQEKAQLEGEKAAHKAALAQAELRNAQLKAQLQGGAGIRST